MVDMTDISQAKGDSHFSQIPNDFPHLEIASAVPGFQPKFVMVEYEGKFYIPGDTPPERYERWRYCEDLAAEFVIKCRRNQYGKYVHLSEVEILDQYCVRLLRTGWASNAELQWVIRRTAELLGWPVPSTAMAS
ncbi:MAG: hypothetical protein JWQ21_2926 [Herminiimonas sp.]|nr:hypothetical protein [Herminiimonas sp.]